jgi:hypothetical protein
MTGYVFCGTVVRYYRSGCISRLYIVKINIHILVKVKQSHNTPMEAQWGEDV